MKIFDTHFHIIDTKFPLVENNGYLPSNFTVDDYSEKRSKLNIVGGSIVSGSFQAFDQRYLINALNRLGDNFYGVANIPINMSSNELKKLDNSGVVAVRFNLKRGGSESVEHLEKLSKKLYEEYDWHTELYLDSNDLKTLAPILKNLPLFSIDHLGLSRAGLNELYFWVDKGIKIKASGFGRIDFDPIPVMRKIYSINPDALLFGTDLPSTRAKIPFSEKDILLIKENFSREAQQKIFYGNGFEWYNKKKSH